MKFRIIAIVFIVFFTSSLPPCVHAQGVKPDIRNYVVHVDTRPMPVTFCIDKTPEEWIRAYIAFNRLQGGTMKFSDQLFQINDQFTKTAIRLTPFIVKTTMNRTMDEPENKPTWAGSICCYGGWCGDVHQLYSPELIVSQDPIATMFKGIRFGSNVISASLTPYDYLPLTDGIYNTQRSPIRSNPYLQSKCDVEPQGVVQSDQNEKGTGANVFWSFLIDLQLELACRLCKCEDTAMYIKTDSMIQYNTDALCRTTGCTQEQVNVVAPESRALPQAQEGGGFINAMFRHGQMPPVQEMVIQLFGSITGKVKDQETVNRVNSRSAPSSYYTTEAIEKGADYLNCSIYPYAKRAEMPECNTKWLSAIIASVTNQLHGSLSQNAAEPTEQTETIPQQNPIQE